jgi:hypothetical protein
MSFNSHAFAAGRYAVVWNSLSLGLFQSREGSPGIEQRKFGQLIQGTDRWGDMPLGLIRRGSEAFWSGTLMEWAAPTVVAAWPDATTVTTMGVVAAVGADDYDFSQALVLTAQTGTPAATTGPATITASKAYLAENFPIRYFLDSMLRSLPMRMRLYPFIASSVTYHYTMT